MKYQESLILLPCHSLEDFPVHHEGDDAQGLLAAWTSLWHPALIAASGAPQWRRVDDPPETLTERLLVIPSVSQHELPTGFAQRAKEEGAIVIRRKSDRNEILAAALEPLEGGDRGVSQDLVDLFLALGYTYLQVELLTRQMRYASNLDELHFNNMVERAAEHAVAGDADAARDQLGACFDILSEERDHYYAVDSFLLDITLTAESTLGDALRDELRDGQATSLMITAEHLELMAERHPETLSALKGALAEQRACLIGGEHQEMRWPLMSLESIRSQWRIAEAKYQAILGESPRVFARRRFGLSPAMPMLLHGMEFDGVMHSTLDEGRSPQGIQVKTRWESRDGAVIDAVSRPPLDAAQPETYLGLAHKLGETMDSDHVATVVMAHWPGQTSDWLRDMRLAAQHNAPLGKFMRADVYFAETDLPGNLDQFEFDQYRSPYLKQSVIRKKKDPISSSVRYWRRRHAWETAQTLHGLAECVSGRPLDSLELDSLSSEVDLAEEPRSDKEGVLEGEADLDQRISEAVNSAGRQLAEAIPRSGPETPGVLVLNAQAAARRFTAATDNLASPPDVERPVFAVSSEPSFQQAVVDAPSFGFTWVSGGQARKKKNSAIAETDGGAIFLRNEFFEAVINRTTGTLQSLYAYNTRGNRMSQQLALRTPSSQGGYGGGEADYSVMAADEARVAYSTDTEAVVECRGRLLNRDGERVAGFSQRYTLSRGQRTLRIAMGLEPDTQLKSDPWNSYYCCRFAWADETSPLSRTTHQLRSEADAQRFEAPHYVDVSSGDTKTTILTGGTPFHRKTDFRVLDSLLIVRGESQTEFEMGIAVDPKNSLTEALSILAPSVSVQQTAAPPSPASSWLFHIDARNIAVTHLAAVVEEEKVVGVRMRLLETLGKSVRATVQAFRPLVSAKRLGLREQTMSVYDLKEGRVELPFASHEWVDLEARWV